MKASLFLPPSKGAVSNIGKNLKEPVPEKKPQPFLSLGGGPPPSTIGNPADLPVKDIKKSPLMNAEIKKPLLGAFQVKEPLVQKQPQEESKDDNKPL